MSVITLRLDKPSLQSIEGEIVSVEGATVVIRYKKPRRSVKSLKSITPFVAVAGEVGGLGTVFFFDTVATFEIEGTFGEINDGILSIEGELPVLINTTLVAVHADVEKDEGEDTGKKKKKGSKIDPKKKTAKEDDDEEEVVTSKKLKKKKKKKKKA